jgi:hypothetical protein
MSRESVENEAPPPGWYPDPEVQGYLRRWDGSAWTDHRVMVEREAPQPGLSPEGPPSPGWYPDPEIEGYVRWWDGTAWTKERRVGISEEDSNELADQMWRKAVTTNARFPWW